MTTPITKELNDRINEHKARQFNKAMRAADKIRHPAIVIDRKEA
jgi:hypothetical protein